MSDVPSLELPAVFSLRRPRRDDLAEVVALLTAAELAVGDQTTVSEDDVLEDWGSSRFAFDRNALVVLAEGGGLAAYAVVLDSHGHGDVDAQIVVRPDLRDRGLEPPLLGWVEAVALELAAAAAPGRQATLGMWCERGDRRRDLYLANGFAQVRSFRQMRMDLAHLPDDGPAYLPPPGVEVRRFVPDRDERAVWAAMEEAFAEHFRHSPEPLDEWRRKLLGRATTDTDLWYVAWDGDEVAGVTITYIEWFGGYVDTIAVRRPWRRRGLGTLLLLTTFAALRERGCAEAVLGVDAENTTGAVGLYERVGMRESRVDDFFEKPLG